MWLTCFNFFNQDAADLALVGSQRALLRSFQQLPECSAL
ncbi:hypothetical protein CES85_2454 [Ochrobactrum quorumnocens]|uniref:Uncharacterized protein n=1 Tax=Ochrobactrum quorumnocens TaxID=271865 RepID=A0A248UEF5_9HYPH|nr:hypothetical protein CES85_2454 [[Ochrobactrum] quorumnocens]